MQQYKPTFSDTQVSGKTITNIQRCLRLNDLELLGDGTHLGVFEMLGLFSFRHWTVPQTIDFWMGFCQQIGVVPDTVTIHPDKPEWKSFYDNYPVTVKFDTDCTWSDGQIGGYCTEFYKEGVEIGNIVNPLGTCIDVGFGKERLERFLGVPPKTRHECLLEGIHQLLQDGVRPSGIKQGGILRKLLRTFQKEGGQLEHPIFSQEIERQRKLREKYQRLLPKHRDKPNSWWYDTHGISPEEMSHN